MPGPLGSHVEEVTSSPLAPGIRNTPPSRPDQALPLLRCAPCVGEMGEDSLPQDPTSSLNP